MKHSLRAVGFFIVIAVAVGCRTFTPTPMDQVGFEARAETQTKDDVTVRVAVLTA